MPEAIKAATMISAEALGMSHKLGSIDEGKAADLLILRKNPCSGEEVLYNPKNIRLIISGGRLAVEEGRLAF